MYVNTEKEYILLCDVNEKYILKVTFCSGLSCIIMHYPFWAQFSFLWMRYFEKNVNTMMSGGLVEMNLAFLLS